MTITTHKFTLLPAGCSEGCAVYLLLLSGVVSVCGVVGTQTGALCGAEMLIVWCLLSCSGAMCSGVVSTQTGAFCGAWMLIVWCLLFCLLCSV